MVLLSQEAGRWRMGAENETGSSLQPSPPFQHESVPGKMP